MQIAKVAQRLLTAILGMGQGVTNIYWESDYEGEPVLDDVDIEDHVFEDNEKDQWVLEWKVTGLCHEGLELLIRSVLGDPSAQHTRKDLPHKVNNWKVDGVTIVHNGDSIEFFEYFEKVSRKH